ncbi:tol-pal system YbgF family protein, partial [Kibdelosporangium lantanae]
PMTARGEETAEACDRLREAGVALRGGASRLDTDDLRSGYQDMDGVLQAMPGHDRMVDTVLDGFLSGVPGRDPCAVTKLTDWLRQRPATRNLLDRSADIVPKLAPLALLDCGDQRANAGDWAGAQALYQQMVDQYPGHELAERAQRGLKQAKEGLELKHLTSLGSGYCKTPAVYSAAPPYAKGTTDPAVVYATDTYDDHVKRLPGEWQADNSHATMVVCVGQRDSGASVRSCRYREDVSGRVRNVTFTKIAYPVKAYELRTGNVVFDGRVEIGGAACPAVITLFGDDQVYVTPADSDIRAAFAPVFTP